MIIKKNWGWNWEKKIIKLKGKKKENWKKYKRGWIEKKKYNGYIKSEPPLIFPIVLVQ
jgi:hypothetical protein